MRRAAQLATFVQGRAAEITAAASLRKKLASGRTLRIKFGIDPTTPDLHLGHVVPLRLLRAFQDAGHRAVLIIGDFTGQIGDPSGKMSARRQLTAAETHANERSYRKHIGRILDLRHTEIHHNREWYGRMRLQDFLTILTHVSLRSAWERDDFQKRLAAGREVKLYEAMYHVLQAYDSVMVRADVEIGALDQKLNILAGRALQKRIGFRYPPQDAVLTPYLVGIDGKQKMSKSVGNTVNLSDAPRDMFGKLMAIPDGCITDYARLAAWLPDSDIRLVQHRLALRENPRDVKLDVAERTVTLYHGAARAAAARREFVELFSKRNASTFLPSRAISPGAYRPVDLAIAVDASLSRSTARRLVAAGGFAVDGRVVTLNTATLTIRSGTTIRLGKKRYVRVA